MAAVGRGWRWSSPPSPPTPTPTYSWGASKEISRLLDRNESRKETILTQGISLPLKRRLYLGGVVGVGGGGENVVWRWEPLPPLPLPPPHHTRRSSDPPPSATTPPHTYHPPWALCGNSSRKSPVRSSVLYLGWCGG